MKNALKSLAFMALMGTLIFASSCSDDEESINIIDPGDNTGSFSVANGIYIASISGTDTTVATSSKLNDTRVEGPDFGTQERSGYATVLTYLTEGAHTFMQIEDRSATQVYGAAASVNNDDDADNTDDYTGGYTVVDLSGTPGTFNVSEAGLYLVTFDTQTSEALVIKVDSWGAIGGAVFSDACTSDGFNSDVDLDADVTTSADGSSFQGSGIILKDAEFKVRFNDSWKVDRRTNKDSYDDANGYVVLTNFGGTPEALEEGGSNISLADNGIENGIYDITFEVDGDGVPSISLGKTADAPDCAFDPANFTWGIIGAATQPDGWGSDKKLTYINGDGGVHKWRAVFPLAGGMADNQFKFRTDDSWATKLLPTTATVTDNTDAGTISDDGATNADGQWFVADGKSGLYYFEINTPDQGATWNIIIDEAAFEIIGAATPGGWDAGTAMTYNDDLASATVSAIALTDGEYKFRVNSAWDFNLGGALDGLTYAGSNLTATAGTYDVTITTADGGVTYTATVE
ncbi:MAG: hypothetical protein HRT61_14150 [Ekhidna sp.]|nr:hypothetical protein [Ekhidna sp.]